MANTGLQTTLQPPENPPGPAVDGDRQLLEVLSELGHEVRTPLNAGLGFGQLLATTSAGQLTPGQQGYIQHILDGGRRLQELLDDVIDVVQGHVGARRLSRDPVALAPLLESMREPLQAASEQLGIKVSVETAPPEAVVLVESSRFGRLLLDFMLADLEGAAPGTDGTIRCFLSDEKDGWIVDVETWVPTPSSPPMDGTSGAHSPSPKLDARLEIAKWLISVMGGSFGAKHGPGNHQHRWIVLPTANAPSQARDRSGGSLSVESDHQSEWSTEAPARVLYVDDNDAHLKLVRETLRRRPSWRLDTARTAEEGLDKARHRVPDVILLDLGLPGMGGREALCALRSMPETRHTPVYCVSGTPPGENDDHEHRFDGHLLKPFRLRSLLQTLDSLLGSRACPS